MKILITGGLGFIGINLIKDIIKNKKIKIFNVDKISYCSMPEALDNIKINKNYNFKKIDIYDYSKFKRYFFKIKPDQVINLAAESHVDNSIKNPDVFIKSNIIGTYNLLKICNEYLIITKKKNFKLLHVSTDEVFGDIIKGRSNEDYPYKPSSPYAASKASSDHLVSSYVRTFKIPAIITNCSNNYGPCQHPEKLIPKLIYNILNNIPLPIYGDGKNSREWIFVEDHCDALFQVFKKGKIGEFYNIGSNKNYNNLEITKKLINISSQHIKLGNHVKIKYVKDRPGHDKRYALNSDKINKKLLWKSSTGINKGLKKTFLWYLNNQKYFKSIKKIHIIKRLGTI